MLRRFLLFLADLFVATMVAAANVKPHESSRFRYIVDVPSDFKTILITDNGDGIGLESVDGMAKLSA